MKLLTLNFLTCAIKTCKANPASFPLHPRDAEIEILEADLNLQFLKNIVSRLLWPEFRQLCIELGLPDLPITPPGPRELVASSKIAFNPVATPRIKHDGVETDADETPSQIAKDLHKILLETYIKEGKLVCGSCEHEYSVNQGVANFLLPAHLV